MSRLISERIRIDFAETGAAHQTGIWSQPFALDGYEKVMVAGSMGTISATLAMPCTMLVYVGKATEASSAMAALTSATAVFGCTTKVQLTNVNEGIVNFIGTIAADLTLVIDGVSFLTAATGSCLSSNKMILSTAAAANSSVPAAQLTTLIQKWCTRLEATYYEIAATTYSRVRVWVKDKYGTTGKFSMNTTAGTTASTDAITLMVGRTAAAIEFTAADVKSTNSSYTHFCVKTSQAASAVPLSVVVVRQPMRSNSTNWFQAQVRLNT